MIECRSENGVRYLAGIIMPWDEQVTVMGRSESFAPGGLVAGPGVLPMRYEHTRTTAPAIGTIDRTVDTDHGLWAEARLLDTELSRHVWEAADAGIVTGFSVEFRRGRGGQGRGGQGRVTDGILTGAAVTERPYYSGARITQVRARRPKLDSWTEWRLRHRSSPERKDET